MFGKLAAYSGLSTSSQNNERVQRELATLRELSSMVDKERQEDMMFQEMEAQQWDKIRQQSDMLLERDKQKISQKAISLQEEMKAEIAAYGSRKAFYANGGLSRLRKYEQDILHSDEANRYKSNLKNLMLIQAAEMKNLGHRLTKQDRENLMKYHRGEDVAITYSGLKNEVEIPFDQYAYGEEIPAGEIIRHGDNYTAIYGNFLLENPDLNAESMDPEELMQHLLAYTKVNYSGQGRSKDLLNAKIAMAKLEQEKKRGRALGKDGKPQKTDYAVEVRNSLNNYIQEFAPNGSMLLASPDGEYKNYINEMIKKQGGSLERLFGSEQNNYKDYFQDTFSGSTSYLDALGKRFFGGKYFQPASAVKFAPGANSKFVNKVLEDEMFKDENNPSLTGKVRVTLSSDGTYLKADGSKVNKADVEDQNSSLPFKTGGIKDGYYTAGTAFIGWLDANGEMLTNAVDKDGNVIPEAQRNRMKKWTDTDRNKAVPSIFIPLKSETGETIFRVLGMDTPVAMNAINEAMGSLSDTSSVNRQVAENQEAVERQTMFNNQEKKKVVQEYQMAYDDEGFTNPYIMQEQKMYQGESGNRNNLIQAFYMANTENSFGSFDAKQFKNSGIATSTQFTKVMDMFPNLQKEMLDYSKSDNDIIEEMIRVFSAETDDKNDVRYREYFNQPDYQVNLKLASRMKAYLNILKNGIN